MTDYVVADIGGTHARLAVLKDGILQTPAKVAAKDFSSLAALLRHYAANNNLPDSGNICIAAAARDHGGGVWRFLNGRHWDIDTGDLRRTGWNTVLIVNDFAASARGVVALPPESLHIIRPGAGDVHCPRAILGPGTGLGLGFVTLHNKKWIVQETFGGHMPAVTLTSEHADIMSELKKIRGGDHVIVYEDMVSGRGLPDLCEAVGGGRKTAEQIMGDGDPASRTTLRLFHEFLGLFAHNAVVTGHAFGGVYLDGGIVHRLYKSDQLDSGSFLKFFMPGSVPVVQEKLSSVPVWLVDDPYVALHGLAAMVRDHA